MVSSVRQVMLDVFYMIYMLMCFLCDVYVFYMCVVFVLNVGIL
jgi:hypothetical protein